MSDRVFGPSWTGPEYFFEWLFPLTGFGASESGIDCRILTIVAVNEAFVFVATRPAIVVLDILTARIFAEVVAAG